jgi:Flp pilus assembly pilin Flp
MDSVDGRAGQGLVEYALIILLVAVAVFAAVSLLAPQLNTVFARIGASLAI